MSISLNSLYDNQSKIDLYISQILRLESRPREALVQRKAELNTRKTVLTDLDSKLSTLNSKAERLTDPIINYFAAKTATSSDTDKFTLSATSSATIGTHSIAVDRLAKSDTRVSKQYTDADSDFTGFSTDQTFSIEVGHPTDSDESNRETISVTISADTFSQTNDDVLQDIASAINDAMYDAVLNETIDNDEVLNASVVSESSGKSRLVLRSEQSGYTYRMGFSDSDDSLLNTMEINLDQLSSGTNGGYMTDPGTSSTDSQLNAQFTLDGLAFYRNSNTVSDALEGVTINLLDTFSSDETITISSDVDAVKEEVQAILDAYNEVLDFLDKKTEIDPDTYESGILSHDITYRGMTTDLRNIMSSTVSNVDNSNYAKLYNIGIEPDDNGKLSIADSDKFEEALEANPNYVSDVFNASDGVASQLEDYLEAYIQTGGTIDNSKSNIDSNIINLDDRIDLMDDILVQRERQLRNQFSKLQEMMAQLSRQQSFFNSFLNNQ